MSKITGMTHVPLARFTSIEIGGWSREFHVPADLDELREILATVGNRPFILGGGTNTLFPDGEFARPVISLQRLNRYEVMGDRVVRLGRLIQISIHEGLSGLEGLVGIPGTAGGAVMMNAGGGGWSFGDCVEELGLIPLYGGPPRTVKGSDVAWGYRTANLRDCIVAWALLRLRADSRDKVRERVCRFIRRKALTQPLGERSAGCVFRNPPGNVAARLIEQLGLKGMRCGGATVSERHANFIVNASGMARCDDVKYLLEEVRGRVASSFGIRLETEIVLA